MTYTQVVVPPDLVHDTCTLKLCPFTTAVMVKRLVLLNLVAPGGLPLAMSLLLLGVMLQVGVDGGVGAIEKLHVSPLQLLDTTPT